VTEDRRVRHSALTELGILDTPSEQAFDDLVLIASQTCDTPIALVSLLDEERQWFKARVGLDVAETAIGQSVCQIDIERRSILEIGDLSVDERTRSNPLVTGERSLRFYAGAPLILRSGAVVGRLCVIDTVARSDGLSPAQSVLLSALARQVSDHLDLRRIARSRERMVELQTALLEVGEAIRRSDDSAVMIERAAAIVGRVLQVDRAGIGFVDAKVEYVDFEADWTAPGVASIVGRHRFDDYGELRHELELGEPIVIEDVTTDERTAEDPSGMRGVGVAALVNMPVRHLDQTVAIFAVHSASTRTWTREELWFLRSTADRLEAGVARFRAEQQQQILNGEISHRLKNMLSMVQAIASQTLRAIPDRAPVESFERRLVALSAAHDVLLQKSWTDADLRTVAEAVLDTVGFADRVRLDGSAVPLGARAALSFSLVVHELMTNACKYGSLCKDGGRVELRWSFEGDAADRSLLVCWRESGGPPVVAPVQRGFGSKLVRLGLAGTGGVDLRFEPAGLEADFRASMRHLTEA
jgi:two-component sensor histidine kinase